MNSASIDGPSGGIDLITISRQFGAGGSELAAALAARLGWRVFDRELIDRVAERLSWDPHTVEALDERPPALWTRIAASLMFAPMDCPVSVESSDVLNPDVVSHAANAAILDAARTPRVVIVGHGAQMIFRNRPDTLHLRLVAPAADRVQRVMLRKHCDRATAEALLPRIEHGRDAYVHRYYHVDRSDPLLYHLQINTGLVPLEEATTLVAELISGRTPDAARSGAGAEG